MLNDNAKTFNTDKVLQCRCIEVLSEGRSIGCFSFISSSIDCRQMQKWHIDEEINCRCRSQACSGPRTQGGRRTLCGVFRPLPAVRNP